MTGLQVRFAGTKPRYIFSYLRAGRSHPRSSRITRLRKLLHLGPA